MGVRCPSPGSSSAPVAAYQYISVELGSPPVRSDGFAGVVPEGEFSAHQCARNESRCSGSSLVSAPVIRSECHPDELQCHRCRLPPESRRHSVSCPMSHGSQGSALDQAPFSFPDGQVYPGKEKCSGAPAQWSRPGSSH